MGSTNLPDRIALEELWRQRRDDAKLRLDFARNFLTEVLKDSPPGVIQTSDGTFAYRQAVKAESSALREYARVLRIYHDLVVNGIIPDETTWREGRAAGAGEPK